MKALFWLLDKLFAILADIGILCLIVLLVSGDGTTSFIICSVVGVLLAAVGALSVRLSLFKRALRIGNLFQCKLKKL